MDLVSGAHAAVNRETIIRALAKAIVEDIHHQE